MGLREDIHLGRLGKGQGALLCHFPGVGISLPDLASLLLCAAYSWYEVWTSGERLCDQGNLKLGLPTVPIGTVV